MLGESLKKLGLPSTATLEELRLRWKALAFELHPDRGGKLDDFVDFKAAFDDAERFLGGIDTNADKCLQCKGSGLIGYATGWTQVRFLCQFCGGTGRRPV